MILSSPPAHVFFNRSSDNSYDKSGHPDTRLCCNIGTHPTRINRLMKLDESTLAIFFYLLLPLLLFVLYAFWKLWSKCLAKILDEKPYYLDESQQGPLFLKTSETAPILFKLPADHKFFQTTVFTDAESDIMKSSNGSLVSLPTFNCCYPRAAQHVSNSLSPEGNMYAVPHKDHVFPRTTKIDPLIALDKAVKKNARIITFLRTFSKYNPSRVHKHCRTAPMSFDKSRRFMEKLEAQLEDNRRYWDVGRPDIPLPELDEEDLAQCAGDCAVTGKDGKDSIA